MEEEEEEKEKEEEKEEEQEEEDEQEDDESAIFTNSLRDHGAHSKERARNEAAALQAIAAETQCEPGELADKWLLLQIGVLFCEFPHNESPLFGHIFKPLIFGNSQMLW